MSNDSQNAQNVPAEERVDEEPKVRIRELLQNRRFVLLWLGQSTSSLGDNLQNIAMMWLVLELTGSTLKMAAAMLFDIVPTILMGPFGGACADRWDRRKLMILADVGRGALVCVVPTLLYLDRLQTGHIYLIMCLTAVVSTVFNPSLSSSIPQIVRKEELVRANSFMGSTRQISGILGFLGGGAIVATMGVAGALYVNGLSFFVSAWTILRIAVPRIEAVAPSSERRLWNDVKEGMVYLVREKVFLWMLILTACTNFALSPIVVLAPVFAKDVLGSGVKGYSYIMASFSCGLLLGAVVLSIVGDIRRKGRAILMFLGIVGITYGCFALSSSLWIAVGTCFVFGAFLNMNGITVVSVFQANVPAEKLGRVFGVLGALSSALRPLSILVAGGVAERVPVQVILGSFSILILILAVLATLLSQIRRI